MGQAGDICVFVVFTTSIKLMPSTCGRKSGPLSDCIVQMGVRTYSADTSYRGTCANVRTRARGVSRTRISRHVMCRGCKREHVAGRGQISCVAVGCQSRCVQIASR